MKKKSINVQIKKKKIKFTIIYDKKSKSSSHFRSWSQKMLGICASKQNKQ